MSWFLGFESPKSYVLFTVVYIQRSSQTPASRNSSGESDCLPWILNSSQPLRIPWYQQGQVFYGLLESGWIWGRMVNEWWMNGEWVCLMKFDSPFSLQCLHLQHLFHHFFLTQERVISEDEEKKAQRWRSNVVPMDPQMAVEESKSSPPSHLWDSMG